MLAIRISVSANNYNLPDSWKYEFQKCWLLQFPEMLAIIMSRNTDGYNFINVINRILEKLATNVSNFVRSKMATNVINYSFQKCLRQMLAIINSRKVGDTCQQFKCLEMLDIYVNKYEFQNCGRQILAIKLFRNVGDLLQQL